MKRLLLWTHEIYIYISKSCFLCREIDIERFVALSLRKTRWQFAFIKMNGNTHIKYENQIENWALKQRKRGKWQKKSQSINHYLLWMFHEWMMRTTKCLICSILTRFACFSKRKIKSFEIIYSKKMSYSRFLQFSVYYIQH